METKIKLLPCPYCCDDQFIELLNDRDDETEFFVYCGICSSSGPTSNDPNKAVIKWNERKYSQKHHQELDRLANTLTELNTKLHDEAEFFGDDNYEERPSYWETVDIAIKIIKNHDKAVENLYRKVAKMVAAFKEFLENAGIDELDIDYFANSDNPSPGKE